MALNTQIKVGADSSGVATGLEPGKRALKDFGASADGAGKSLAGMGNGSAQSAQKVEQATKSMIQSIQRTTAATEAGDKSTRAYQESLARMRGIDVAALKPYLDQLDAAKSKAAQATTANNSLGDSFAGLGSRSVIAASAIGMIGSAVAAAFSAASIKGVIDVADTFSKLSQKSGVAVEALRELNYAASLSDVSTEALGTGLRKLSQNMAAAAGGGKEQAAAFAAIGLSVKGVDGALKGADQMLYEVAGKFANFSDGPEKAALAIELFGKQGADMIPLLNSGTSGLSEMAKEADELGIVFGSDLAKNAEAFNDNLTRIQTSSEGAKIAIANELLPTLNYMAQAFLDAQKAGSGFGSFIGGALKTIIEAATILYSDVEFVLKGIGREFGAIGAQVVALGKLDIKGFNAISAAVKEDGVRARAELDKFQYDILNAGILSSKAGAGRGTANDPRLLGSTQTTAPIIAATAAAKELREVVNKAAKEDIAAFRLMADLKTKFQGEEMARIEKTREELEKTMEAYAKAAEAGVSNAIAAATAAEAELSNYGLLKSEVQALGLVQLEQSRESAAMAGEDVANIEKRIAAQKRLIAATKGVELRTSSDNAAKEAAAEWKRTADGIQNTLTDALMRGFESGKDFARNLRDTVVNMFKTLVLRPIISAVINPVAGALTGALGLSGAAQAAGTGSSVLSSVGTIAGLASTFGAGLKAGFAGLMGEAGLMGTLSAGTTALGAGNIAGGLGTLGGPLALATAAILGLSAIIKATSGETRNGAKYGVGTDGKAVKLEGPSGGEIAATQAQAMFNVAKSSIEGLLTGLGSKAVLTGFTAGLESSENGKGFAYATGAINGKSFGDVNTYMNSRGDKTQEQALKDYQLELTQSILEGLQVTEDIPASIAKLISDGLNGSEVKALSLEATSAILANVEMLSKQVNTFNAAMTQLPFEKLKNLSFDTAAGLIAAAGGFEQLDANLSSYYQSFYTAEEQRAQNITNTEAAFAALGKTMPTLDENARSVYRSMVEAAAGMDLSVEANAKAYTGLLSLNDEMNLLAPAIDTVAQSAADAAATMTSAWANVMQARGAAGNDVTKFTAQAAIDAAFAQFKKTDKYGIASASQFQTITQADFANYSSDNQKLIATILTGFSDLSKANAPAFVEAAQAAQTYSQESYSAPTVDTSIADAIAAITKGLTDVGVSFGVELLKAQGKTVEAMAAQRAIDTAGYNAAQVAIYDYNQTLRDQITALGEAAAAKQAFDGKLKSLQQQYDDLTMNQAQKRNAEWLSLNAQDTTGQLSGLQIAIWDFGDAAAKAAKDVSDAAEATRTAAAASKEQAANELSTAITRNQWRDKLDVLMGSRTQEQMDTQNALAGVTDLATVELILLVRGLEKTQVAAATAAAAAKELADQADAAAKSLAATNQTWQDQLDVLTGAQTDRSIALRDTTEASTRALMEQVYAQQDLKTAAEEATQAAATLKAAFESLESARVSVASAYNSIKDKAASAAAGVVSAQDAITQGYLSALDAQISAQQNVADITRQAAVEMRGFADDIQDFILQMSTSDLGSSSKAQQLAASQADFAVSAAQARAGDKNALAGITGKASNLLGAGKDQFASATDYARFTAKIGNTLQDLATLADGKAGPLAEAIDPMVKAQADLLKANQDVEKWTQAASRSSASTAKTVSDYLSDWTRATAENAIAQSDLRAAQLLTQEIDLETLDVLGELRVLIESYNNAKSSVTDAGGILPSLTVGTVAIIPSVFNPIASGSGDTARLEALIDGLTQEVIGLRAEAQATAGHTSRTARLLDRAMPDGDALATRTAA